MRHIWVALGSLALVSGSIAPAHAQADPTNAMKEIADSHLRGNIPKGAAFDRYLRRDLTAYFAKATGKKVTVAYEFLRDGPTQSGVSYPKYYLWVTVRLGKKKLDEGAVRVAAINRERFEVTDFLSKVAMKKDPAEIDEVFPQSVGEKIRQEFKQKEKN